MMKVEVKRPGKLYIAGEYSIVEAGRKSIVTAIDSFIFLRLEEAKNGVIESFNGERVSFTREGRVTLSSEDTKWAAVASAMNIAEDYLSNEVENFSNYYIKIESQMEDESGKKFGLGSSASVTVAMIDAICKFYGQCLDPLILFKLASLAVLENSPNNSCGDVAAVSFEDLVYYRSFNRKKIIQLRDSYSVFDLVNQDWPLLDIKRIGLQNEWDFSVGWTGKPASSFDLVNRIKDNKKGDKFYQEFLDKSDICVDSIVESIEKDDFKTFKKSMDNARENLVSLGKEFDSDIETRELRTLSDIAVKLGYASKLSGAGGGDCGIAIADNTFNKELMIEKWEDNNIKFLNLDIYRGG